MVLGRAGCCSSWITPASLFYSAPFLGALATMACMSGWVGDLAGGSWTCPRQLAVSCFRQVTFEHLACALLASLHIWGAQKTSVSSNLFTESS
jgi:hypothetical protein